MVICHKYALLCSYIPQVDGGCQATLPEARFIRREPVPRSSTEDSAYISGRDVLRRKALQPSISTGGTCDERHAGKIAKYLIIWIKVGRIPAPEPEKVYVFGGMPRPPTTGPLKWGMTIAFRELEDVDRAPVYFGLDQLRFL